MHYLLVSINYQIDKCTENSFETFKKHLISRICQAEKFDINLEEDLRRFVLNNYPRIQFTISSHGNYHFIQIIFLEIYFEDHDFQDEDFKVPNELTEFIEQIFESVDSIDVDACTSKNEDGIFFEIDDSDIVLTALLKKYLDEQQVKYRVINHTKISTEAGAGDYRERLVVFVQDAIASGLTYDMLKLGFSLYASRLGMEYFKLNRFPEVSKITEHVRHFLSETYNENQTNIELFDVKQNKTGYELVYLTPNKKLFVNCDSKGAIKETSKKDLTQTGI